MKLEHEDNTLKEELSKMRGGDGKIIKAGTGAYEFR